MKVFAKLATFEQSEVSLACTIPNMAVSVPVRMNLKCDDQNNRSFICMRGCEYGGDAEAKFESQPKLYRLGNHRESTGLNHPLPK